MERENPFHADAVRDLADGKGGIHARAVPADHHALELLDALLVSFYHAHMHVHRVAGSEIRDPGLQLRCLYKFQLVHWSTPVRE
jgi:hypothetical protein